MDCLVMSVIMVWNISVKDYETIFIQDCIKDSKALIIWEEYKTGKRVENVGYITDLNLNVVRDEENN